MNLHGKEKAPISLPSVGVRPSQWKTKCTFGNDEIAQSTTELWVKQESGAGGGYLGKSQSETRQARTPVSAASSFVLTKRSRWWTGLGAQLERYASTIARTSKRFFNMGSRLSDLLLEYGYYTPFLCSIFYALLVRKRNYFGSPTTMTSSQRNPLLIRGILNLTLGFPSI